MKTLHRFAAIITAGSLALSALPALALEIDGSSDTSGRLELRNNDAAVSSETKMNANIESRCKHYTGTAADECRTLVQARLESKADAKMGHRRFVQFVHSVRKDVKNDVIYTREKFARIRAKIEKSIERSLNALGKFTQKICASEHESESAVQSCIGEVKASISAKISAMINIAFGS